MSPAVADDDQALRDALAKAVTARRIASSNHAQELQWLADYARATEDDDFATLEVATLLCMSDRAAQARLTFARELTERLPRTLDCLRSGRIEEYKAKLIADTVIPLSDEHATHVEDLVLDKAPGQTVGQLRAALTKAVMTVDPEGAEQRRQARQAERRVTSQPTGDGQAVLSIYHSAAHIALIRAALRGRAHQLRAEPDEPRTLAQIEADLAADLLLGRAEALQAVEVHLTLPAPDQPAELEGVGPITAPEAQELLAEAKTWRWIRTDPDTRRDHRSDVPVLPATRRAGQVHQGARQALPIPRCTHPARRSELDHRIPWPTGPTSGNLNSLCKRHHRAKHEAGWQLHMPKPGWFRWISPLGHTRTVSRTAPDPPPF